ncbi:MAG: hypothetical protein HQL32_01590 [Planctomycetes bacterium]|nr:hypothetical protein [Planctomycetota bacterium]
MDDGPKIPCDHFLKEMRKAMEHILKLIEDNYKNQQEIVAEVTKRAALSRPWHFILKAYQVHDNDFEWLKSWCTHCVKLD